MTVTGDHLGMPLVIRELDHENQAYFKALAEGELRLQRCAADGLYRYPPTTRCPSRSIVTACARLPSARARLIASICRSCPTTPTFARATCS